jgi:predicted metal-dependent peptidase
MFPHDKAMSKAKIGLMYDRSTTFYAAVAMRLPFHWDNSQPTAYTDYKSIGYNTEFFMELSAEERVFLLAHEAMHVAHMHNFRIGTRNHKLWNDACDYAINIGLRNAGLKLPQGGPVTTKPTRVCLQSRYLIC